MVLLYGAYAVEQTWQVNTLHACIFLRVYYVIEGSAIFQLDGQTHVLQKGHLYCFPSNKPYVISRIEGEVFHPLFVHLDIAPLVCDKFVDFPVQDDSLLESMMRYFIEYCHAYPDEPTSPFCRSIFSPLVPYFELHDVFSQKNDAIDRSIDYIIHHINDPLSIEELSAQVGYHPQYYIRLFTKVQGMTPHRFIMFYRMRQGFYNLCAGKTVAETATSVGFVEAKNFARAFHKHFGVTPSEVIKHHYL